MSNLRFLFWNIDENPIEDRIVRIIKSQDVDVLALVEPGAMLEKDRIASITDIPLMKVSDPLSRFALFSRVSDAKFDTLLIDPRWLIVKATFGVLPALILVIAHLPSKTNADDFDQLNAAIELNRDINDCEARLGHSRTIIVGDLNMNPFEPGIAMNQGLHAASTRHVANREVRTIQRREYPLFYNPMWSLFGDRTPGPPGSYYRTAGQAINYAWNIYDQVLLRPSVMASLDELRILDTDGEQSLLTENGFPDRVTGSDHLPILFSLNLDEIRS